MLVRVQVSVSLRSIIHSYFKKGSIEVKLLDTTFPSPYGVSFILICSWIKQLKNLKNLSFPSPYGVSFILILHSIFNDKLKDKKLGFRLLTEYHSFLYASDLLEYLNCNIYIVSVSLRSIIHSYTLKLEKMDI